MTNTKRVTIVDVARHAGVSPETVSRVLNGKGPVRPETAARVRAAIDQLGYRPNAIARSLVQQRTRALGILVPDIANPFFPEIVHGIESYAQHRGYHVLLCNTAEQPEREVRALEALAERRVDAVILCSSRLDDAELLRLGREFPAVVLVNRSLRADFIRSVRVDDELGMALAMQHLYALGRRNIAYIAGPATSQSNRARLRTFTSAQIARGCAPQEVIIQPAAPVLEGGVEAARALLEQYPYLDALVAFNDLVAIGALQACRERGHRVPQDIAVIGFDDIPLAALVNPPLTTVHIPKHELGLNAAALALDLLDGRDGTPAELVIPPRLIVRASTQID